MKLQDVKPSLNCLVHWTSPDGYGTGDYIFHAYRLTKDRNGKFWHSAELLCLNGDKGMTVVNLDNVEPVIAGKENVQ